jgi:hypothetical protein
MRSVLRSCLVVASFVAVGASADARAQAVEVPHAVTCPTCRLEIEPVFTVGAADTTVLALDASLVRDGRGRYFARGAGSRSVIVWDSAGTHIGTMERPGDQYRLLPRIATLLVGRDDSLFVADSLGISVFSPSLGFVRSVRFPAPASTHALLPDGRILVGSDTTRGGRRTQIFRVLNPDSGTVERTFMAGDDLAGSSSPFVSGSGGSLWHLSGPSYRLERWAIDGTRGEGFELSDAPWFRRRNMDFVPNVSSTDEEWLAWVRARSSPIKAVRDSLLFAENGGGSSLVSLAGVDRAGRVWVSGSEAWAGGQLDDIVWNLEIIDPVRGSKFLSIPVSQSLTLIPGTDLAYSRRVQHVNRVGTATISVWRVRIVGPRA